MLIQIDTGIDDAVSSLAETVHTETGSSSDSDSSDTRERGNHQGHHSKNRHSAWWGASFTLFPVPQNTPALAWGIHDKLDRMQDGIRSVRGWRAIPGIRGNVIDRGLSNLHDQIFAMPRLQLCHGCSIAVYSLALLS